MKKIVTLCFCLMFAGTIPAQNLDSLFNRLLELKSPVKTVKPSIAVKDPGYHKCAFSLMANIKLNYHKFSSAQQIAISSLLMRPQTDTTIESNYFKIHYDLKGDSKPAYSLQQLVLAADSVYEFEVGYLGYPAPPSDNGAGGDNKYDIYIIDVGDYGYTEFETAVSNNRYTSFMVIDNDFVGVNFHTSGINAARVTMAHEFHHAIQIGNYTYRSQDEYYQEASSTAMEEFVFDYVNDYFFYLPGYFDNPQATISNHSGYDLAILNIYIKERFGFPALKRIWENINNYRALKAINVVFEENSTSFKNEFSNFNIWTFYTGFRSIPGSYFKDARHFPLLAETMTISYSPPQKTVLMETAPVSNNLILFINNSAGNDSIYTIVSNADYINGYYSPYNNTHCDYSLYSGYQEGLRRISDDYYVKLTSPVPDLLKDINIINNQLVVEEYVPYEPAASPFPQPFNYSRHNNMAIPAPNGVSDEALLYIYTLSMKLVYSGSLNVIKTDKLFVRWNGLDDSGARLPNGVYFYVTKRDDTIIKGKLVVQHD